MRFTLPFVVFVSLGTYAAACPYAGGTFAGSTGDLELKFVFNANCSSVEMTETFGGTKETAPVKQSNRGWQASFSRSTQAKFDAKGSRVQVSRGGHSRSVRLKAIN